MSDLSLFLKKNKKEKENITYAATKSLLDADGNPVLWTIKPLTTKENEDIRDSCTKEIQVTGKPGMFRQRIETGKYLAKMTAASIVEPNLYNAELQDSYGVKTPEDLLIAMVDDPGEYNALGEFVQNFNGFTESMDEKVEQAKN